MSPRTYQGRTVFQATVDRLAGIYAEGHRVVNSFSGGKDSLAVLECSIIAAQMTNRLPVEVVMRDEELGWPDHYEFCERTANRPEVDFTWIIARQPHSWAYDRENPFWWAFDDRVPESRYVRMYPPYAQHIPEITIEAINSVERFPPFPRTWDDGQGHAGMFICSAHIEPDPACRICFPVSLISTIGIRAGESRNRTLGVHSMGGWLTKPDKTGKVDAWPIYDWTEKDVWHAISEFGWDYPKAYADLARAGVPKRSNRMGAFLNRYAMPMMPTAAKVWPEFFERLYARFPGLRVRMAMGPSICKPKHRPGETWERTFWRECVEEAPAWIAKRAEKVASQTAGRHLNHTLGPIADAGEGCFQCGKGRGSWADLAESMYMGDPFSETAASGLRYVEPEEVRPELRGTPAGRWNGHPG